MYYANFLQHALGASVAAKQRLNNSKPTAHAPVEPAFDAEQAHREAHKTAMAAVTHAQHTYFLNRYPF